MKNLKFLLCIAIVAIGLSACNKKKESFGLTFHKTAYYFKWGGETQTDSFSTKNISAINVTSVSDGWTFTIDLPTLKYTVTPPAEPTDTDKKESMRTGTATISVISHKGETARYVLTFYIIGDHAIDLNDGQHYANCYVATTPYALYSFDATKTGNGSHTIAPEGVKLLWQSKSQMIQHLAIDESGSVSFFIDRAKDDDGNYIKEDGNEVVPEGNAVIAVCNADDEILWSWHIWVIRASKNPLDDTATYANGKTFMNKNLGAFANSNGATDDTDAILASYGLYYQWGRKDPFTRPNYYNCAGGTSETIYGSSGAVYLKFAETNDEVGTAAYATANPKTFITNAECIADKGDGIGDWLKTADGSLWSDTAKTDYDPCPYGWRVPAKSDFDVLSLPASEDGKDLATARKQFGWLLSDGSAEHFYTGAGFRSYYNGVINNMNHKDGIYPSTSEPWEGYYWTSGQSADGRQSLCMYFDLTTTRTINKFNTQYPSKRANAMQIRCVKIE